LLAGRVNYRNKYYAMQTRPPSCTRYKSSL
jgi:hypothetical protein